MLPLIIDTDPGVDDAFGLALAAAGAKVDLRLVTTTYGNVPGERTAGNALRVLEMCGCAELPVARGADGPLAGHSLRAAEYVHGRDGLGGQAGRMPLRARPVEPRPAVEVLAGTLLASDEPVTVVALGPLTNVATLLAEHPEAAGRIGRLVVMGGGFRGGNVTASAEFNIWCDPEAARRVIVRSDLAVTLVPLDLTHRAGVSEEWMAALVATGAVGEGLSRIAAGNWAMYERMLGERRLIIHDLVAVAEAVWPGILRPERVWVDVEDGHGPARGATLADRRRYRQGPREGREIDVAADFDAADLHERILARFGDR
ncbi:nucleoside hydrolase [Actinoplanes sp. NBRC 103695]|uniref:nucleoside hydrolase n=1 Tax=Actinoplanes sp. NBRC 103695 TaxID=3032202 RepID=UPI0024A073EE|nr:nucleoside hydrolase [Actinoplanes sp. NBRC 103695]GLZ00594.1 purine nucleosidase [Actinoplanes sp. NBRC 103695]